MSDCEHKEIIKRKYVVKYLLFYADFRKIESTPSLRQNYKKPA